MMGDFASVFPTYDGDEHVFAAAQHIVKALVANKNLNEEMRRILADLDTQLSTMNTLADSNARATREMEEQLKFARRKVMSWESNQSMIWASGAQKTSEYLQAVYEIQRLTESLGSLLPNRSVKQRELLEQAHSVLQMAMERLEKELIHILAQNKRSFGPENISFGSCEEDVVHDKSIVSLVDDLTEDTSRREISSGTESVEHIVDLVHPDVTSDIKSIANVMFASNYGREFCHTFVNFWKGTWDEYFSILGIDRLSIEDLLKMEWGCLDSKIKKWMRAIKFVVRVYLASEKRLFEQVLGEFGSVCSTCFIEASEASMLSLLNFGQAMAIGTREPDKLFRLLDVYEVLSDLLQDINSLFSEEFGSSIRAEFQELIMRLGDAAKATFMEFGNAVASNPSTNPFPRGGIHHLTRYVMNYINLVVEYAGTLNLLLGVGGGEEELVLEESQNISAIFWPVARHLRLLTSNLEFNLDDKSRLYKDRSLKHIFMMNNLHYMVKKVQGSELRTFFGDEWIRESTWKFQQQATSYERVTWNPVLSLIRGNGNLGLKEQCRIFNVAFEEVYKSQTGWSIPDSELRKDLRISTSQKVIHLYQTFIARASNVISDKHIKYSAEDLESHILELFEGTTRSLNNTRKR